MCFFVSFSGLPGVGGVFLGGVSEPVIKPNGVKIEVSIDIYVLDDPVPLLCNTNHELAIPDLFLPLCE